MKTITPSGQITCYRSGQIDMLTTMGKCRRRRWRKQARSGTSLGGGAGLFRMSGVADGLPDHRLYITQIERLRNVRIADGLRKARVSSLTTSPVRKMMRCARAGFFCAARP